MKKINWTEQAMIQWNYMLNFTSMEEDAWGWGAFPCFSHTILRKASHDHNDNAVCLEKEQGQSLETGH